MCGIAGILNFKRDPVRLEQLQAMTDRMVERGPDDDGFYLSGAVGLGFRRLSIIDLAGGHQPLSNEDGSLQLVFNGEIYNHVELRAQLISRGHIFRTKSDAEVLLHLYEEKGVKALDDLNGMFAFALFDSQREALWIARDRLGIKPLFFAKGVDKFVFASDIRALRAVFPADIDSQVVLQYLALAYVPGRNSMWKGVKKLPPASYLWVEAGGKISCTQYWSENSFGAWQGSISEAKEQLNELLLDAIGLQMRSDVPVGIFLSGGVDSSAIVSYAAKCTDKPLRTYTINFLGKGSSDAKYARLVADRYATNHMELQMDAAEAVWAMDELLLRIDEPISDSAIFPTYFLSKAAQKQGVKVLLNGAGGDEIFGGYDRHFPPKIGSPTWVAQSLPPILRSAIAHIWEKFDSDRGMRAANPMFAWGCGISGVSMGGCKSLLRDPSSFKRMMSTLIEEFSDIANSSIGTRYTYDRMALDLKTYLPGDILSLVDKASMAASVECRVPLLDHRLVEFAFSLPASINFLNGNSKGLFKEVLSKNLPMDLLGRKKEGFNAPITAWMQTQGALNLKEELLGNPVTVVTDLFSMKTLENLLANRTKSHRISETLFSIYLFNRWFRSQTI